jgi:hypothetical protein
VNSKKKNENEANKSTKKSDVWDILYQPKPETTESKPEQMDLHQIDADLKENAEILKEPTLPKSKMSDISVIYHPDGSVSEAKKSDSEAKKSKNSRKKKVSEAKVSVNSEAKPFNSEANRGRLEVDRSNHKDEFQSEISSLTNASTVMRVLTHLIQKGAKNTKTFDLENILEIRIILKKTLKGVFSQWQLTKKERDEIQKKENEGHYVSKQKSKSSRKMAEISRLWAFFDLDEVPDELPIPEELEKEARK